MKIKKITVLFVALLASGMIFALEPKEIDLLENKLIEPATGHFLQRIVVCTDRDKIENIEEYLGSISKLVNAISVPEKYNFDIEEQIAKMKEEYTKKANESDSPKKWCDYLSWYDAIGLPVAVTIDCFGGSGFVTGTYLSVRGIYEGGDSVKRTNNINLQLGDELSKLSKKDIEEMDLGYFESLKASLMSLDGFIKNELKNCPLECHDSYRSLLKELRKIKKDLSLKRCNYVSYSFLAPRFKYAQMYAELYNAQWRIWGFKKRDPKLINAAFDVIGNHGDLIMQASPDCRQYFTRKVIPALKKKLSKGEYEDHIALTGYNADGSTGPELWLDWKN